MKRHDPITNNSTMIKRLKTNGPRALVWFRSDIRLIDQPALFHASQYAQSQEPESGVIGLYIINRTDWMRHALSPAKIDVILGSLKELKRRLASEYNIPLLLVELDPSYSYAYPLLDLTASSYKQGRRTTNYPLLQQTGLASSQSSHHSSARQQQADGILKLSNFILAFIETLGVSALFYNREYEYDEALRDKSIKKRLVLEKDIHVFEYDDQCLVKPGQVTAKDGKPYQVFTFFKKLWLEKLASVPVKAAELLLANTQSLTLATETMPQLVAQVPELANLLEFPIHDQMKQAVRQDWPVDESSILNTLHGFVTSNRILNYKDHRDFPALIGGTSKISAYLAVGSLAPMTLLRALLDQFPRLIVARNGPGEGESTYLSELCWREFYRHILYHFPRVSQGLPFQPGTVGIRWRNDVADFENWKKGQTGYPIVDASMRQLNATGWMHNRCRMIVASFLTKDLLIDWRWGERYFSETLVDMDLASNNGGWQWSASTGTDAQPFFRIFSPLLQSERFDPKGDYIKRWMPELESLSSHEVHAPYDRIKDTKRLAKLALVYPKPIVDHAQARLAAIQEFKRSIAEYKQG